MPSFTVDCIDQRNPTATDDGTYFGFVYFTDGRRVTYATGHGVTEGTGGWAAITQAHRKLAEEFLNKELPGWNTQE
jgi:hypothetical protein